MRKFTALVIAAVTTVGGLASVDLPAASAKPAASANPAAAAPIYLNPSYSPVERAIDLVSRMTLAEKAAQMNSSRPPAIPRLGVAAWGWWNESNHGVNALTTDAERQRDHADEHHVLPLGPVDGQHLEQAISSTRRPG